MFIAITAFGNPQDTIDQIMNMYSENNFYSIHWNKRDKKYIRELTNYFKNYKNVYIFSKVKVYWGHDSIITAMEEHIKIFRNQQHEIFLHLCNKTINTKNIDLTESIIKQKLENGYNFFDYSRKWFGYIPEISAIYHENEKTCLDVNKLWQRNYDYKINMYSGLNTKLNQLLKLVYLSFSNPLKTFGILNDYFSKKNIDIVKNIRYNFYLNKNEENCIDLFLFSKKNKKIPHLLSGWEFPMRTQIAPFLCIKREELFKLINTKEYTSFRKFIKGSIWTEDWFFSCLYYNMVNSKKELLEKSLIININIYDWENSNALDWNKISQDILFFRRVKGLDKIQILNKKLQIK